MIGDAEKPKKYRKPSIKFGRNKLVQTKIKEVRKDKNGRLWNCVLENAEKPEVDRQVAFLKRVNKKEHDDYRVIRNGNRYDLLKRKE